MNNFLPASGKPDQGVGLAALVVHDFHLVLPVPEGVEEAHPVPPAVLPAGGGQAVLG